MKSLKSLCNDSEPKLAALCWSDIEKLAKETIASLEKEQTQAEKDGDMGECALIEGEITALKHFVWGEV